MGRQVDTKEVANNGETELLQLCVSRLRKSHLTAFLANHGLPNSGTKSECLARISTALTAQIIHQTDLIDLLDEIEPWDKQQVYLFRGPEGNLAGWTNVSALRRRLAKNDHAHLLNCRQSLGLPTTLTLSCIDHEKNRLRIHAVERRDHIDRRPEQDKVTQVKEETVYYQAYAKVVTRGLVTFEWDMLANTATLQVSQLPSRESYENRLHAFTELVSPWLDLNVFSPVDLSRAISAFHKSEGSKDAETRSQEIDYSVEGRRVSGRSATATDPLLGVAVVDKALHSFRKKGVGYSGNFYFTATSSPSNPIPSNKEVHVHLLAEKDRVRFYTANNRENFSYVLQRIRNASQR